MKKYIKVDWPESQSILEYSKNVYNVDDSQSIFIEENEYNIIKECIKLDKYLKVLKDKDILYVEDKYKNNWIIIFKEYKDHKIHSYCSHCINTDETYVNSQEGIFANLLDIKLITIANNEHLKQVKDDKYLKLYLNKEESFKDGDILTYMFCNKPTIYIYRKNGGYNTSFYVAYSSTNEKFYNISTGALAKNRNDLRFATEEEKQKLFDIIKANGFKWNAETKTLEKLIESKEDTDDKIVMSGIYFDRENYADEVELHLGDYEIEIRNGNTYAIFKNQKTKTSKPKFKVGDKIKKGTYSCTIVEVKDNYYLTKCGNKIVIENQDDFSLISNKFNIDILQPFDKVLVRCNSLEKWHIQFFEKYNTESNAKYPFICLCNSKYCQCIPFNGNEYLLGTTNDCDEYYKTWE